ncbi:hypothetical protein P7C70_g3936, partial [Phenoliferia sp. Uapishka_3]
MSNDQLRIPRPLTQTSSTPVYGSPFHQAAHQGPDPSSRSGELERSPRKMVKTRSGSIWKSFTTPSPTPSPPITDANARRAYPSTTSAPPPAATLPDRRRSLAVVSSNQPSADKGPRRPSLALGKLSFRRSVYSSSATVQKVDPLPTVTKWQGGAAWKDSEHHVSYIPLTLDGLGIGVEEEKYERAMSPLLPRIPSPRPRPLSSKVDGHAYYNALAPAMTYSPTPMPQENAFEPLRPTITSRSRPSSGTSPGGNRLLRAPVGQSTIPFIPSSSTAYRAQSSSTSSSTRTSRSDFNARPESSVTSTSGNSATNDDYDDIPPPVPTKANNRRSVLLDSQAKSSANIVPPPNRAGAREATHRTPTKASSFPVGKRRSFDASSSTKRLSSYENLRLKRMSIADIARRRPSVVDTDKKPLPDPGGSMYVLRPTVDQSTQTPDWDPPPPPPPPRNLPDLKSYSHFRRQLEEVHHSSQRAATVMGTPSSVYPPSPSVYSVRSMAWNNQASRAPSIFDSDGYGDDTAPETPVIMTAFRQQSSTLPPELPVLHPNLAALYGAKTSQSTLAPALAVHDESDEPTTPRMGSPRALTYSPPPSPPPVASSNPRRYGSVSYAWEAPPEKSAWTIANSLRRRSVASVPNLPLPSTDLHDPSKPFAPLILRTRSAPSHPIQISSPILEVEVPPTPTLSPPLPSPSRFLDLEPPVAMPQQRRRASQPNLGLSKANREHMALTRAEKGRSFFLVQALNNQVRPTEQIESHFCDSSVEGTEESDGEDESVC